MSSRCGRQNLLVNTVGTLGLARPRIGGIVSCLVWEGSLITAMVKMRRPCFTYVDDLLWITQSGQGLWRILGTIFLLVALGTPMAWRKFQGGQEHGWIGFSLFASRRWVGISQRRTDWLVNWFRKTRADGMVRVADMQAVLGRLSFAFSILPTLRPFLGPVCAWVGAMQSRHVMPLPKACP